MMITRIWFFAFVLAIIFLFGHKGVANEEKVHTALALKRDFSIMVRALGEFDAARSTIISSSIKGQKGRIIFIIKDGSFVKKNDLLVKLDPSPFEEKVEELTDRKEEYEAVVETQDKMLEWEIVQGEREVEAAKYDLRSARLDLLKLEKGDGPLELARLENSFCLAQTGYEEKKFYVKELEGLKKRGFANPMEIEQAKKKVNEAKMSWEVADRQYKSYKDYVLPSLIEKARSKVSRARINIEQIKKQSGIKIGKSLAELNKAEKKLKSTITALKKARKDLESTIISAPLPGIAVLYESYRGTRKRKPRVGDSVMQNQPLVYLPDISKMIVKSRVREVDLYKIGKGKPALISVDAYPCLRLHGKVEIIGVLADSQQGTYGSPEKHFQVIIAVLENDMRLRPGMTARVEIQCEKIIQQLSVPIFSIFTKGEKTYCFVKTSRGFQKKEILISSQNESFAVVLSGLLEGDTVALTEPFCYLEK